MLKVLANNACCFPHQFIHLHIIMSSTTWACRLQQQLVEDIAQTTQPLECSSLRCFERGRCGNACQRPAINCMLLDLMTHNIPASHCRASHILQFIACCLIFTASYMMLRLPCNGIQTIVIIW